MVEIQKTDDQRAMHRSHALNGDTAALTDLYRDWSDKYDSDVTTDGYVAPLMCALLAEQAAPSKGQAKILDVGCGTGLVGKELHTRLPNATLVGADLSPEMTECASETGHYDSTAAPIDINLPLPEGWTDAFDVVVCCGTFTNGHVGPARVEKLLELCTKGGTLVMSVRRNFSEDLDFASTIEGLSGNVATISSHIDNGPYIGEEGADYWSLTRV